MLGKDDTGAGYYWNSEASAVERGKAAQGRNEEKNCKQVGVRLVSQ